MNRAPDGTAFRSLRSRPARESLNFIKSCHIFDRNFHPQIEALRRARIDDGYRPIDRGIRRSFELRKSLSRAVTRSRLHRMRRGPRTALRRGLVSRLLLSCSLAPRRLSSPQIARDFPKGPLSGGKTNTLNWPSHQMLQSFYGEREMRPTFAGNKRMNFVDYHHFDGFEHLSRIGRQKKVKRLGSGNKNVGGITRESGSLRLGGVAGTDRN